MISTHHTYVLAAFMLISCALFDATSFAEKPAKPATPTSAPANSDGVLPSLLGDVYTLDQFGKIDDPIAAQAAFDAATKHILAAGGGTLMIPAGTADKWFPQNISQEEWRVPAAPAPATRWGPGPGITVIDARSGTLNIQPPQATGLKITRILNLPQGQSLPFWDAYPMLQLENVITHGSCSYHDRLQVDVKAGNDAKFFVPTIRGLFPGMFITVDDYHGNPRIYIKSLGYDKEQHLWYFTADTATDVRKGAILSNKNHVNIAMMETFSHNENQTFDIMLRRHNYSQGDNYMIDARFKYMGDVNSTQGDENGVLYAAFIESETNIFTGKVDSWNAPKGELVFKEAANAQTLGSGRPIINLNPKKWITDGSVWIVRPSSWTDDRVTPELVNPVFRGNSYPTTVHENRVGVKSLFMGGLIRFSADAPVTDEVVGRYFCIDEATEYVPPKGNVKRWYLIDSVTTNSDGTKDMKIIRNFWGAKAAGSPTLYNPENYSFDGHEHPLKYIIAPGVNTYDVSDGVLAREANSVGAKHLLRLAPSPFAGSQVDFASGDPIEQAIGPDPFKPVSFRSWTFERVPGVFPAAIIDIANLGSVQRETVLSVHGPGPGVLNDELPSRYDHLPQWNSLMKIEASCNDGLVFAADVNNSAMLFKQPNGRVQPIKWLYGDERKSATLSVSPADGTLTFTGGPVAAPAGLAQVAGLSGTSVAPKNLRNLAVDVPAGTKELTVKFPIAETDAAYAVFVETDWMTSHVVSQRNPDGFVVKFSAAPDAKGTLQWMLVR